MELSISNTSKSNVHSNCITATFWFWQTYLHHIRVRMSQTSEYSYTLKSWIHSLDDFVPVLKKENKWKCSFSPIRGSSFYFSPPPLLVANINQSAGHICKLLQMAYSSTAVYNLQMPV